MTLKEIKHPEYIDTRPIGEPCPKCGTPVRYGRVKCPDYNPNSNYGCLVLHYGWHCDGCDTDYEGEGPKVVNPNTGEKFTIIDGNAMKATSWTLKDTINVVFKEDTEVEWVKDR